MFSYQAPNPEPKKTSLLSSLFSFSNSSLGSQSVGKLILPAQGYKEVEEIKFESKDIEMTHGEVVTHDDAHLSTIIMTPKAQTETKEAERNYIIKFNGNGAYFQAQLNEFAQDVRNLNVTVIGFNYRNVADSTLEPKEFKNLVTDGIAQVQHLLDKGVPSKHILLDGHSLGGSIATKTAEHFHKIKKPVFLWNDRSFATLPKAAAGIICSPSLEFSMAPISSSLMSVTGWNVDAASAYQAIPVEYKSYMVVINDKNKSAGDGVISTNASLHETIFPTEKKSGKFTGHTFYSGRMFGHNLHRKELICVTDEKTSAQDVFTAFVKKSFGKTS